MLHVSGFQIRNIMPPIKKSKTTATRRRRPTTTTTTTRFLCRTTKIANEEKQSLPLPLQRIITDLLDPSSSSLPILDVVPQIQQQILPSSSSSSADGDGSTTQNLVLEAPPGAGKTTMVPLALLQKEQQKTESSKNKNIWMVEPRRVAVRSAATRMSELVQEPKVGGTVGYKIRGETKTSSATQITVVTDGILLNEIRNNPELNGIDVVILDEYHERSLNYDVLLTLLRQCQQYCHPNIQIIVMSATLMMMAQTSDTDDNDQQNASTSTSSFGRRLIETLGGKEQCKQY